MIEHMCLNLIGWGITKGFLDEPKKNKYIYACDLLLSSLITMTVLLIVALVIEQLPAAIIFHIAAAPLRKYGGGWHAPTHYLCTIIYTVSFLVITGVSLILPVEISLALSIVMGIVLIATIIRKVPVDNPNNPFIPNLRKKYKWICLTWGAFVFAISITLHLFGQAYYATIVCLSLSSAVVTFIIPMKSNEEGGEVNEESRHRKSA